MTLRIPASPLGVALLCTLVGAAIQRDISSQEQFNTESLDNRLFHEENQRQDSEDDNFLLPEGKDGETTKASIQFVLYTSNTDNGTKLQINDSSIATSKFNGTLNTIILIHGWIPDGNIKGWWISNMTASLFAKGALNIIVVNWVSLNNQDYYVSAKNSAQVGLELALLLQALKTSTKALKPQTVHIIGFDIGAHIAGVCGWYFVQIGTITGLDPAGPYFQNVNATLRLDKDDAAHVIVVHTDTGSMGYQGSVGNVDIYFNGGVSQPGAAAASPFLFAMLYLGGASAIGESHIRSVYYYQEYLDSKTIFHVYPDSSYANFLTSNNLKTKYAFGLTMDRLARGDMYILTQASSPYLSHNYVRAVASSVTSRASGIVSLVGTRVGGATFKADFIPTGGILNVFSGDMSTTFNLATNTSVSDYRFSLLYSSLLFPSFGISKVTLSYVGQNRTGSFATCAPFNVTTCPTCNFTLALTC